MFKIFADYHTHTLYSHGKGTVEENILAAKARGLEEVAITDHGPGSVPWIRTTVQQIRQIRKEVDFYGGIYDDVKVLVGVEANITGMDGSIDIPREAVKDLDLLLVGYHPMVVPKSIGDAWKIYGRNSLTRYSRRLAEKARVENTKALVEAVLRHDVDIVTHPGLNVSIDTAELARACARKGTALEINAGHGYMTPEFCRTAAREGARFVINSDAHRPADVGRLERGIQVAVKAGLTAGQIINAREEQGMERPAGEAGQAREPRGPQEPREPSGAGKPPKPRKEMPPERRIFNPDVDTDSRGPWAH